MTRRSATGWRLKLVAAALALAAPVAGAAHTLEIDTDAARATLDALANPSLTEDAAHKIALLPANQQLIRKIRSYGTEVPDGTFEEELVAAARGQTIANERFGFTRTKAKLAAIRATLTAFDRDSATTSAAILERVQQFSPPGPALKLKGWIIAGGNSTGFAFGDPEFYLKIDDFIDAPDYLQAIMAHELYHAVQGAAQKAANIKDEEPLPPTASAEERRAADIRTILSQLQGEGSATLVGDPANTKAEAVLAAQERNRIRALTRLPKRLPTLLDMAIAALSADPPVPIDDIYEVGFYADQPLYYLGYAMAKTIADKEGPARIGQLALDGGCGFAMDYISLVKSNPSAIKLGPITLAAIAESCSPAKLRP